MPNLQELDSLKNLINKLGNEPGIMAKRGEEIPEPPEDDYGVNYYAQSPETVEAGEEKIDSLLSSYSPVGEDEDTEGESGDEGPPDYSDDYSELASQDFILDDDELVRDIPPETESETFGVDETVSPVLPPEVDVEAGSGQQEEETPAIDSPPSESEDPSLESIEMDLDDASSGSLESIEMDLDDASSGSLESIEMNLDDASSGSLDSIEMDLDDASSGSLDSEAEFSISDLGEQLEDMGGDFEEMEEDLEDIAPAEQKKEFTVSGDDFRIIRENLAILPNRMKLGIEEFLGDSRRSPGDVETMAKALLEGRSPRKIAKIFFSLTGMRLQIPRNYRLYHGQIREQRRNTLQYKLAKLVFSILLRILVIAGGVWILGLLIFTYVYRPLKAGSLYEAGLEALARDDTEEAVAYFNDAWYGWPLFDEEGPAKRSEDSISEAGIIVRGWKSPQRWLEYARAFRARKHWMRAVDFYDAYLGVNINDTGARAELGKFLAVDLGRFEDAEFILSFMGGRTKKELIIRSQALGDLYLEWAMVEPQKYEQARTHYARLLEFSGGKEQGLLSMMRYHLRRGNDDEVELLIPSIEDLNMGRSKMPELAADVYARTGEFLLKRGQLTKAREFIDEAIFFDIMAVRPRYTNAQYWRIVGDTEREFQASLDVLVNLKSGDGLLGREELIFQIMALGNMGRIQYLWAENRAAAPGYGNENAVKLFDRARASYREAIDIYENALRRNQLGASRDFASLYLGMGGVAYSSQGSAADAKFRLIVDSEEMRTGPERRAELDEAFKFYLKASELLDRGDGINLVPPQDLYRYGYVRYMRSFARGEEMDDDTFLDFYRLTNDLPRNPDSRFALANVLLLRANFENALHHYAVALSLLDEKVAMIGDDFDPATYEKHREILLRYVAIWNNRGVASFYSGTRRNEALGYFTVASDFLDDVNGDFLVSSGVRAQRDEDFNRLKLGIDGRESLEDEQTYPYRNRLMLLGLEDADELELFTYLDIPFGLARE